MAFSISSFLTGVGVALGVVLVAFIVAISSVRPECPECPHCNDEPPAEA